MTTDIPILLLGIEKLRGDLGLGVLKALFDFKPLAKEKNIRFVVRGVCDNDGYICCNKDNGHERGLGLSESLLKSCQDRKQSSLSMVNSPWAAGDTKQYANFIAQCYQPGMVVLDMIQQFDQEKFSLLMQAVKDLNLSLVSPLSRPPAFKERSALALGTAFKSFSKLPSAKRLLYSVIDSFKGNNHADLEIPLSILQKYDLIMESPNAQVGLLVTNQSPAFLLSAEERQAIIKNILDNPKRAVDLIQSGSIVHVVAVSHLVGLGPNLSLELKLPHDPSFDPLLGFGLYFTSLSLLPILIQNAKHARMNDKDPDLACYLECLANFLYSSARPFEIAQQFCMTGGLELVSLRGNGGLLSHKDESIQKWTRQILWLLMKHGMYVRHCCRCGSLEETQGEWDVCAGCKDVYYCSEQCQCLDWARGHDRLCGIEARYSNLPV